MILMSEHRISRTLQRMAFEVMEFAGEQPILLIGLNTRGHAIAKILFDLIEKMHEAGADVYQMDAERTDSFTDADEKVPGSVMVFVDDVIFSGLTLHQAMRRMDPLERAENVLVAALVDRGHRRLPVRADITGMHVPTKLNENIEMVLKDGKPYEMQLQVEEIG